MILFDTDEFNSFYLFKKMNKKFYKVQIYSVSNNTRQLQCLIRI